MALFSFRSSVAGLPLVLNKLKAVRAGIVAFIGKRRIEKYLVARAKARFEPRGSNPLAQREPSGKFWPWASQATVDTRRNTTNRSRTRALYATGRLQNSISITKKGPGLAIVGSSGSFVVGIRANAVAAKYALLHQQGGRTPNGATVPARPFLGVSATEEEELSILGKELIERRLR